MAPQPATHPDVALDLALAVIASSTAPPLLLNEDLTLAAQLKTSHFGWVDLKYSAERLLAASLDSKGT